jgi:hypothetical protein
MDYWLDWAGFAAAGGIGGLIYWTFAERELIVLRVRLLLRRR